MCFEPLTFVPSSPFLVQEGFRSCQRCCRESSRMPLPGPHYEIQNGSKTWTSSRTGLRPGNSIIYLICSTRFNNTSLNPRRIRSSQIPPPTLNQSPSDQSSTNQALPSGFPLPISPLQTEHSSKWTGRLSSRFKHKIVPISTTSNHKQDVPQMVSITTSNIQTAH